MGLRDAAVAAWDADLEPLRGEERFARAQAAMEEEKDDARFQLLLPPV